MTHFDPTTGEEIIETAVLGRPREQGHAVADFIKYNNALPILLGFIFLGGGGAFAATNPEVQSAVVSKTEVVHSIDNTYITSVNLNSFEPKVKVTGITEDNDTYYVAYDLYTIDLAEDDVWKQLTKPSLLKVSKDLLRGGDLGLYAQNELAQVTAQELVRLQKTQAIERAHGVTQKTVATAYEGIIGKFISPSEETFPGYNPIIDAPPVPKSPVPAQITTLLSSEAEAAKAAAAAQNVPPPQPSQNTGTQQPPSQTPPATTTPSGGGSVSTSTPSGEESEATTTPPTEEPESEQTPATEASTTP